MGDPATYTPADTPPLVEQTGTDLCFHCGLSIPAGTRYSVDIDGSHRAMCCPGCEAVARAIVAGGYENYYRHRTRTAENPSAVIPEFLSDVDAYDNESVQKTFVRKQDNGERVASLILQGITCAACSWLNERHLRSLQGVTEVRVNYSTHRAEVHWRPEQIRLSDILRAVQAIGYAAYPYDPDRREQILEIERKQLLKQIGVAGALGMQLMMIAVALYFGDWFGIDSAHQALFRWVSLILAIPVLMYSARPFFANAWRDLQRLRPGMDVPVALGLAVAFAGSVWSTLRGHGQVYFESVAMFTLFLLTARYFELLARQRSSRQLDAMTQAVPNTAVRIVPGGTETVAAAELNPGDRIRVLPGANVPADGLVVVGASSVSETLLTGESTPHRKGIGDVVLAGSVNLEQPMELEVTDVDHGTVISQIVRLVEHAQSYKPHMTQLADRAATVFVVAVLGLAVAVGAYWWHQAPDQWLGVTVSVLVITCPCALSLATPTALTAAANTIARWGMIATDGDAIERLARIDQVVFDKTGTLTEGRMSVAEIRPYRGWTKQRVLSVAAALEAHSEHPLARAVVDAARRVEVLRAEGVAVEPGGGVSGSVNGTPYHLGHPGYVLKHAAAVPDGYEATEATHILLADDEAVCGALWITDRLRVDAVPATQALLHSKLRVALYSGDQVGAVAAVAGRLGIRDFAGSLTPGDKLTRINALQAGGRVVAMIGDGINDAPVMSAAQVSVAMGQGADLARINADIVLLNNQLSTFVDGLALARRTLSVIRQNIVWAITYNLSALPAAVLGLVPPWLAALGMSVSSLLVVGNAMRLGRPATAPSRSGSGTASV